MADARIRTLERAAATGDADARGAYLLERVRCGEVCAEDLRLAAFLGEKGARRALLAKVEDMVCLGCGHRAYDSARPCDRCGTQELGECGNCGNCEECDGNDWVHPGDAYLVNTWVDGFAALAMTGWEAAEGFRRRRFLEACGRVAVAAGRAAAPAWKERRDEELDEAGVTLAWDQVNPHAPIHAAETWCLNPCEPRALRCEEYVGEWLALRHLSVAESLIWAYGPVWLVHGGRPDTSRWRDGVARAGDLDFRGLGYTDGSDWWTPYEGRRVRDAVRSEVVPWLLGEGDPLRDRLEAGSG